MVKSHWIRLPWQLSSKESAYNAQDAGLIPESGSSPEEGNGNLGNPMDRGAWWATVQGIANELDMNEWLNHHHQRATEDFKLEWQAGRIYVSEWWLLLPCKQ